jgi:hypothetical protein
VSTIGTGRIARLIGNARAEKTAPAAAFSPADTPYRLLWFTGIVAVVLCLAAFALWGLNGAGTLFDMIAAFCT